MVLFRIRLRFWHRQMQFDAEQPHMGMQFVRRDLTLGLPGVRCLDRIRLDEVLVLSVALFVRVDHRHR